MNGNSSDIQMQGSDLEKRIRAHTAFLGSLVSPLYEYREICMRLQGYTGDPKAFKTDGRYGFENTVVEYIKKAQEYLDKQPGEVIEVTARKIFYLDSLLKTFLEQIKAYPTPRFWEAAHKKAFYHDIQAAVREEIPLHHDLNFPRRKWYQLN